MRNLRRFADPRPSEGVAVIVRPQARALLPLPGGPQLSSAARQLLRQIHVSDEYGDGTNTCSLTGCALFHGADLWLSIEDVGRGNAIDAVLGWLALHGERGGDKILFTTGRLAAEIVAKSAYSGAERFDAGC